MPRAPRVDVGDEIYHVINREKWGQSPFFFHHSSTEAVSRNHIIRGEFNRSKQNSVIANCLIVEAIITCNIKTAQPGVFALQFVIIKTGSNGSARNIFDVLLLSLLS